MLLKSLLRNVVSLLVASCLNFFTQFLVVYLVAVFALNVLAELFAQLLLQAAHGLDSLVGSLEGSKEVGFLNFLHLAFHHHDVLFGSTDHEVHVGFLELLEGWVDDKLAVDACNTHLGDGAVEGNITASQSCRSGKASQSIGHIHAIGREKDYIHINFSMIIAGEERTQSAVHQTTSQNLVVVCLTLTLRKATGKTAGSKILLSVLYLQGHEICSGNGIFGCTNSGQEHRVVHTKHHGTIGLLGKFPGLDADGSSIRQLDCLCNYVHLVFVNLLFFFTSNM